MKELRYFLISLFFLGVALISYSFVLDALLIPTTPKLGYSFKQFLLKNCPSPKVIVDSGSNSHFGINSEILSDDINRPVINISDNATYPLSSKINLYKKYLNEGDTLILPLEWRYYYTNYKSLAFYSSVFRENVFYYRIAPLLHKLHLIFTTPYYLTIEQLLLKRNPYSSDFYEKQFNNFDRYLDYNQSGDLIFELKNSPPNKSVFSNYTWDKYTLGNRSSIKGLSSSFKSFIKKLEKLSDEGIRIIIVPPAMVSSNGYSGFEDILDSLTDQVSKLLSQTNLIYLSNYKEYSYPLDAGYDTFYHLNPDYRDLRTQELSADISKFFIQENLKPEFDKPSFYRTALHKSLAIDELRLAQLPEAPYNEEIWIRDDTVLDKLRFDPNWYPLEKGGVWAKRGMSSIYLNVPLAGTSHLEILGKYFDPPQVTKVYINGHLAGEFDLSKPRQISLSKNSGIVRIGFLNNPTTSPRDVSGSGDRRKLSLGLRRVKLIPPLQNK